MASTTVWRKVRRPKVRMNRSAHASSPALAGSQGNNVDRLVAARAASDSAAVSKSSTTVTLSGLLAAPLVNPSCRDSGAKRVAGPVVSPSRSRTALSYSVRVSRRSGEEATHVSSQSTRAGGPLPPNPPPLSSPIYPVHARVGPSRVSNPSERRQLAAS